MDNNESNESHQLKKRKKDIKIKEHISDLEKTILLNKDCINNIIPTMQIKQNQKRKLLNSLLKIS